ncbi:MAG: tryptophan synthase subunit alpha, partial [Elusimicrobia bacterium]|nr:tryptophan synthase subunit alpha [Elusimicrobiota bacterium]
MRLLRPFGARNDSEMRLLRPFGARNDSSCQLMNRITQKFNQLRRQNKKALSCFITAGYPDLSTTGKIIRTLEDSGVDLIELGVPFSDPIADGPVIQHSSAAALSGGVSLRKVLDLVKQVRVKTDIPIVIMSYLNPLYSYGLDRFFSDAAKSGVDGLIIPDIIMEESSGIKRLAGKNNVLLSYLVAPTTSEKRRRKILKHTGGFVYAVSLTGVTGPRKNLTAGLREFLTKLRRETRKPVLLGFGISNRRQIRTIKKYVDGVIIGSALIDIIRNSERPKLHGNIRNFLRGINEELKTK